MDNSFRLLDLTVYGRQETWEDSPAGWPKHWKANADQLRTDGRPIAQWPRLKAGYSDDLGTGRALIFPICSVEMDPLHPSSL